MALSEYYFTSAHSVFIAALLALSTLFFIYKGRSDTEDAFLTLAGVSTFTAALVPQGRPDVFNPNGLPEDYKFENVILPNIWAVVVALVLGWLLALVQYRLTHTKQTRSRGGTLSLYFLRLVVTLGLIVLVIPRFRYGFINHAHGVAGTLMILAFIATVLCAAYVAGPEEEPESPRRRRFQRIYRVIAVVMLVTLVVVVTLHIARPSWVGKDLWIIVLETTLILEFAAYWVVQSIELWDTPDPRDRLPEKARSGLPKGRTKRGLRGLKDELAQARKDGFRQLL
jgi:amino acid transporter